MARTASRAHQRSRIHGIMVSMTQPCSPSSVPNRARRVVGIVSANTPTSRVAVSSTPKIRGDMLHTPNAPMYRPRQREGEAGEAGDGAALRAEQHPDGDERGARGDEAPGPEADGVGGAVAGQRRGAGGGEDGADRGRRLVDSGRRGGGDGRRLGQRSGEQRLAALAAQCLGGDRAGREEGDECSPIGVGGRGVRLRRLLPEQAGGAPGRHAGDGEPRRCLRLGALAGDVEDTRRPTLVALGGRGECLAGDDRQLALDDRSLPRGGQPEGGGGEAERQLVVAVEEAELGAGGCGLGRVLLARRSRQLVEATEEGIAAALVSGAAVVGDDVRDRRRPRRGSAAGRGGRGRASRRRPGVPTSSRWPARTPCRRRRSGGTGFRSAWSSGRRAPDRAASASWR